MSKFLCAVLLCGTSFGCRSLGKPDVFNPGPADYQINRAKNFDPFPDPDIGPEIVGGRPLGFMEPRTETDLERRGPPPQRPY